MPESKISEAKTIFSAYNSRKILKIGIILAVLYVISLKDYLLFHSIVEIVGASVAVSIFLLAWNSRRFTSSGFYVFIGSAFLVSAMITILHALAYKGMGVMPGVGQSANVATQLWLANQYLLAVSFFAAPFFARRKMKLPIAIFFFAMYFVIVVLSIFWWKNFPTAYVEGRGLTPFKDFSEYIVALLFLVSAYIFYRKKSQLNPSVVSLFCLISILFAVSTLFFTLYVGVYSSFNMWGHLIRIAAMYPVYIGVVEFGLMTPYDFLFGNLKAREESLKKNEKMFRAVVEDQTEFICRFLPDGTLTFVNDAYCRYYGMARGYLLGRKYFEHMPKDVAEKDKEHLSRLNLLRPVVQVEHRAIDKKGWHRWQHWTTRAIFDSQGKLVEYQSVGRDITERRSAEQAVLRAKEEWERTFDSVPDLIAILDSKHRITRINKAMAERLGRTPADCIGLNCFACVHGLKGPIDGCPHSLTLKDGKEHMAEVEEKNLGGTFLVSTTPFFGGSGKLEGSIHVARDITERKKMEKAKDEFISLASHQLKTPLSSIALSTELLLRGVAGEVDLQQKKYMKEIFKATKRMTLLINNLLNVSRVEMGNFEIRSESFDMSLAIKEIVKGLSPLAAERDLTIKKSIADDIAPVKFDVNSFGIIFENLLSNAIRYTPAGGKISIDLKNNDQGLLLSVSDTGCGIPEKQKNKIFEKSFRAKNAKEVSSEGAGLGLYMTKIAAERGGAKIWFETEEGKGTTFFVLFQR